MAGPPAVATPAQSLALLGAAAEPSPFMTPPSAPSAQAQSRPINQSTADDDDPDAGGLWKKLVQYKSAKFTALRFFANALPPRELRPERLNPLQPDCSAPVKWKRVKEGMVSAMAQMRKVQLRSRAEQNAAKEFELVKQDSSKYWEQGDEELHTKAVWEQRMELQTHPAITEELHTYWVMLRRSFAPADEPAGAVKDWGLSKDDYTKLQLRFYKVLIKPFDPVDARKCARMDWKTDMKGNNDRMGRLKIYDSIFEIADVWCKGVRAQEYVMFLRLVFDAISHGDPATLAPLSAVGWMDAAAEAARIANDNEREQAALDALQTRRSSTIQGRLGRRHSAADAEAAVREFEEQEQRRREEEEARANAQTELDDSRDARLAAARAEAEAAAAARELAAMEALLAERMMSRFATRGFWKNGPPPEVMAEWAKRATKPSRDQFSTPTNQNQHFKEFHVHVKGAMMVPTMRQAPPKGPSPPPSQGGFSRPAFALRMKNMKDVLNHLQPGSTSARASSHHPLQRPIYARHMREAPTMTATRDANCFRPNSARTPRRDFEGTRLPPGAIAMQASLARSAPREMQEFYQRHQSKDIATLAATQRWKAKVLNEVEIMTGLDLDGDGDVGVE